MHRIRTKAIALSVLGISCVIASLNCSASERTPPRVNESVQRLEHRRPAGIPNILPVAGIVECSGRVAIVPVQPDAVPCWCRTSDIEPIGRPIPQGALDAIEAARDYLSRQSMLPPEWQMCANPMDGGELHVTCWPLGRYLNSPVTLVVRDGVVVNRFYSDTNDLVGGEVP